MKLLVRLVFTGTSPETVLFEDDIDIDENRINDIQPASMCFYGQELIERYIAVRFLPMYEKLHLDKLSES